MVAVEVAADYNEVITDTPVFLKVELQGWEGTVVGGIIDINEE